MPGAKRPSPREGCEAGRKEEGFRGGGYAGTSAEAAVVGASAPDDTAELFLNGLPHCEQNGAVRSTSEPHCWHRSICNGSTDRYRILPRLEVAQLQPLMAAEKADMWFAATNAVIRPVANFT
jgi:hypothetical protein